MGCCCFCWSKKQDPIINKPNQNGFKSLFHATNEFDLSTSDSENEEQNYSLNSIKKNKQSLTNKIFSTSNGCNTSSTTSNSIMNNQISQTGA